MELLERITREGERGAEQIRAQAEEEARRRLAEAERRLVAWRAETLQRAEQEAEGEKRLILSRARAHAREIVLRAKSEAGEQLFSELSQEAACLRSDPERYRAFLARCLQEAESEIRGPLVLHVDPRDEELMEELLRGTQHRLGDRIETPGGFLATNERGDLLVDNRLETRIVNLRQRYRPELSAALFDRAVPSR